VPLWRFALRAAADGQSIQQPQQRMQLLISELAQQALMQGMDLLVHAIHQFQAGRADARQDFPPVLLPTMARDQPAPLQPLHQARDVGVAMDHASCNLAARQACRLGSAQNPQSVVLGERKLMRL